MILSRWMNDGSREGAPCSFIQFHFFHIVGVVSSGEKKISWGGIIVFLQSVLSLLVSSLDFVDFLVHFRLGCMLTLKMHALDARIMSSMCDSDVSCDYSLPLRKTYFHPPQ